MNPDGIDIPAAVFIVGVIYVGYGLVWFVAATFGKAWKLW